MDIFFIYTVMTWINAEFDKRLGSEPIDLRAPVLNGPAALAGPASLVALAVQPTNWLSRFKKMLFVICAIGIALLAFPSYSFYIIAFIFVCMAIYGAYRSLIWFAPWLGPLIIKFIMDVIILAVWIYTFMSIFAFNQSNYALMLIPVMYLIFSVIYIFAKYFMQNSDGFNIYTYGFAATSLLVAVLIMRTPAYVMGASAFSVWLLRNSSQYMSYVPSILLISAIFMIISSLIVLISYNLFIAEYTKKTGKTPVLSGLYAGYYDNYTISMKSFAASVIILTLAYNTYVKKSIEAAKDATNRTPWFSWLVTNLFAAITITISSIELFNSSKFIHISRSSLI